MNAPPIPSTDYDASVYGCVILFIVLTTIAIVARATARYLQKVKIGLDDILAYVSYTSNLVDMSLTLTSVPLGTFDLKKLITFTPRDVHQVTRINLIDVILYTITLSTAKLSVLFLIRRIFGTYHGWFRTFWWVAFLLVFPFWFGLTLGFAIWQSSHFTAGSLVVSICTVLVTFFSALADVIILSLPIKAVLSLQMSRQQKFGIIAVFCLGFAATLVSSARAILDIVIAAGGVHWTAIYTSYNFTILAATETSAASLCACFPVLKPFLVKTSQVARRFTGQSSMRSLFSGSRSRSTRTKGSDLEDSSLGVPEKHTISQTREVDVLVERITLQQIGSSTGLADRSNMLGFESSESASTRKFG